MRYLNFSTGQTDVYTASLSKYLGSYLITLRGFWVPLEQQTSKSLSVLVRRYFGDPNAYAGIHGSFGETSTEFQFDRDTQTRDFWSIGISGQYPLSSRFILGAGAAYDSATLPGSVRRRFSIESVLSYRF
jgi:YaiO family outer membrane protein